MDERYTIIKTRGVITQKNATGILGCGKELTHSDFEQETFKDERMKVYSCSEGKNVTLSNEGMNVSTSCFVCSLMKCGGRFFVHQVDQYSK